MTIVSRYEKNPILTRDDVPYPVATVHNAGMVKHEGRYVMLFRSHRLNGRSIIGMAESEDGYHFKVHKQPFLTPATDGIFAAYEEFGVEDLRICTMPGEGYLLTYSGYSRHGVRIILARTYDFKRLERIAPISQADMRNVVIFPHRFENRYARLDRPHTEITPWSICISFSKDLIYWGDSRMVMAPLAYHWDEMKIGPGATPIRTEKGWLHIYHGVFKTMAGSVYRLGAALHDLTHPEKILGVADDWILQPEDPWEVAGYVNNVVFTCGAIAEEDGTVKIYWGGADSVMCTGTANLEDLIRICLTNSRKPI